MLPGFNHNLRHRETVFHVQTEDCGRNDPKVVTQLFLGGRCLDVDRWDYREALDLEPEALETIVRTRMADMHKTMLRRVTRGQFDAKVFVRSAPAATGDARSSSSAASPVAPPPSASPPSAPSRLRPADAPTLDAPVEALDLRAPAHRFSSPPPPAPDTAPSRKPAFETSTLSEEELLAEIDAELRRRGSSPPRRLPSRPRNAERAPRRASDPAPSPQSPSSQSRARRLPSAAHTLVEPPAVMEARVQQARAATWPDTEAPQNDDTVREMPRVRRRDLTRPGDRSAASGSDPWGDERARTTPETAMRPGAAPTSSPESRRRAFSSSGPRRLHSPDTDDLAYEKTQRPAPAEPPDAPTLEDVILDYLSNE